MNTQLQKLFDTYNLGEKDRYEFLQIYRLLPSHKQIRVIEQFDSIIAEIQLLRHDLALEQSLLLGEALENIDARLQHISQKHITQKTRGSLESLKDTMGKNTNIY